jgi:hypothetical protein
MRPRSHTRLVDPKLSGTFSGSVPGLPCGSPQQVDGMLHPGPAAAVLVARHPRDLPARRGRSPYDGRHFPGDQAGHLITAPRTAPTSGNTLHWLVSYLVVCASFRPPRRPTDGPGVDLSMAFRRRWSAGRRGRRLCRCSACSHQTGWPSQSPSNPSRSEHRDWDGSDRRTFGRVGGVLSTGPGHPRRRGRRLL